MGRRYDTVTLLTDLGSADESAGVLHAVLRDLAPHARAVDLTHEVPPFDVRAGALALVRSIAYVPAGIVVASVDPEVGTSRKAIAVEVAGGDGVLVGPDNGLLAPAIALAGGAERAVVLDDPAHHLDGPGATNATRDIFVPVAAQLCNGVDFEQLGSPIDPALLLPSVIPLPRQEGEALIAEVLWVDRFGNAQLNLGPDELAGAWGEPMTTAGEARVRVLVGDEVRAAIVVRTFADLPTGALGLVLDSFGMYTLTMQRSSAATDLRVDVTDQIRLEPLGVERSTTITGGSQVTPVSLRPGGRDG